MKAEEGKSGLPRRAWRKLKGLSRKTSTCVNHPSTDVEGQESKRAAAQQSDIDSPNVNGHAQIRHSISNMSTASSNRSYYTANDVAELDSRVSSNRLDRDSLAELDAYGAEVDEQRQRQELQHAGSGKRAASLKLKAGDLPPVPEADVRLQENGDANEGSQAEAYPSGERGEFLKAYDAAVLEMLNRLHGSESPCVGSVPLLDAAPWNRKPGYLGSLTPEQEQGLVQMKRWFPGSKCWHTDHDLLRFLRAREFDLPRSREMYAKYIEKYRGSTLTSPNPVIRSIEGPFDLDLLKSFPERDIFVTAQMQKLKDYFLHTTVFHLDKEGRPVVYFRPANIVKHNMNKYIALQFRIAFQSSANEAMLHLMKMASQKVGYHVENSTQVLDLGGMSALQMLSHMRSEESQSEWQHNMDFQPEVLYKIYIINAPAGMSAVWKFASFFVPAATRSKVQVFGGNYFSALEKVIGKDKMPSCYGGDVPFTWQTHRSTKELKP